MLAIWFQVKPIIPKLPKILLAGNGYNLGITRGLEFGARFGVMTALNYNFGNLSNEGIDALRKKYDPKLQMEFSPKSKTWEQAQLMTGFGIKPVKKVPIFIEATGGIGYIPKPNTLIINEKGLKDRPVFAATEKSFSPVWNAKASFILTKKSRKKHLWAFAGIGSNGITGGVTLSLASSCCIIACPCMKGCLPPNSCACCPTCEGCPDAPTKKSEGNKGVK